MPLNLKSVVGVAAAVGAYTYLVTLPPRLKYRQIARIAIALDRQNDALNEQMEYLCEKLDQHDVPVDEFDLIVLNYNQMK